MSDILEEYSQEKKLNGYILENDGNLFLVLAVIVMKIKREDFFKKAEELIMSMKKSKELNDRKLYLFGSVNGVERHEIWITKPVGKVITKLSSKRKVYTWKSIFKSLWRLGKALQNKPIQV